MEKHDHNKDSVENNTEQVSPYNSGHRSAMTYAYGFDVSKKMNTKNPTFESRMVPHLKSLAGKLLEKERFGSLAKVSDMLAGLSGGGWARLPVEDKTYYLKKMSDDFHPRAPIGDSDLGWDEDYHAILELISNEEKGLRRK